MPSARSVFVTGGAGFVGSHLVSALRARGDVVTAPGEAEVDLLDATALRTALERAAPSVVVHLAAISHVPTCESDPERAARVNVGGTAALLAAMTDVAPAARLVFASSAHVYAPSDGGAIDETFPLAPQNVYARTKRDAERLIAQAGLSATMLRLFNHTHKSQAPTFFLPHLHRAILDGARRIPVGNLQVARDLGSLQDLIAALVAALALAEPQAVFNVCSGKAKRLDVLATQLAARLHADVELVVDPARVRAGEPAVICGSHRRFTAATGWEPRAVTEQALIDAFLADA